LVQSPPSWSEWLPGRESFFPNLYIHCELCFVS
jgi:hypothetical protein